jgi:hypothetical protein
MCRNIRTLYNFEPAATPGEIRAAALQYVRKVSGSTKPSATNQAAFDEAVDAVAAITQRLFDSLVTSAPPKDREVEAAKARARNAARYGTATSVFDHVHDDEDDDHHHPHDHDHDHDGLEHDHGHARMHAQALD